MSDALATVEVVAPQASAEFEELLLRSCSSASTLGECKTHPSVAEIRADVSFDDGSLVATISVGRIDGSQTEQRILRFLERDLPGERWRAVGLVMGTVAEGLLTDRAAPRPTPPTAPTEPMKPTAATQIVTVGPPPTRILLDALALVGSGLDDGSIRAGFSLRGAYVFPSLPLMMGLGFRYSVRPADEAGLEVHWIGGSCGLGLEVALAEPLWLDARVELMSELVLATVEEPFTGASDISSRWLGGGRLSSHVAYMPSAHVGVIAGADGTLVQSGTVVRIREDRSGRAPPYSLAGNLGIRFVVP